MMFCEYQSDWLCRSDTVVLWTWGRMQDRTYEYAHQACDGRWLSHPDEAMIDGYSNYINEAFLHDHRN